MLSLRIMIRVIVVFCLGICLAPGSAGAGLTADEERTVELFETVSPSVVFIKNAALQWDWFSSDVYEIPSGAGSGFVWDRDGHIITNFHVVYQADRIQVLLSDQKVYPAKIVGASPDHDLAVLKIESKESRLTPVRLGDSDILKVGQRALSIGNPFGFDYSLTTGVVSALGRTIRSMTGRQIHDVIQTDAAINPGNSGGPLLNSQGEVIGISTMIVSPSGAYAGVGFAIPVNVLKRVVPQLITYGRVRRASMGVVLVSDIMRRQMGIEGALILQVQPGGPAASAGLRGTRRDFFGDIALGDVVVAIGDQPVVDNDDLFQILERDHAGGDRVTVYVMRAERRMSFEITLQDM